MKHTSPPVWQWPTKYADIMYVEYERHARRVAELRDAEKLIRAIEPDLRELVAKGIHYASGVTSFYRLDIRNDRYTGRAVYALVMDSGATMSLDDQLAKGFIGLGYEVERCEDSRHAPRVFLRRPKTQIRVVLRCTPEFRDGLTKEAA